MESAEIELKKTLEKIEGAFETFKKSNDEKWAQLEKKGYADPIITSTVEKIQKEMNELREEKKTLEAEIQDLRKKSNRREFGSGKLHEDETPEQAEHRKHYNNWVRTGAGESELKSLEQKSMSVGTSADGGYAVPSVLDREIYTLMRQLSPMRNICRVITVGNNNYSKLVNIGGTDSGWVGETAARTATNTSQLTPVTPFMGEIYANPQATQMMLDDGMFDVEAFIAEENAFDFAKQEGIALVSGNGTNKPKGVLAYTFASTDDGVRAFGQIQYVPTGVAGDWAATNKADKLKDLKAKLKKELRVGAVWVMNGALKNEIEQFKDSTGQYLWRPGLEAGSPDVLLGHPIEEMPAFPDKAASSLSVLFGNFKRSFYVIDRIGTRTLRDPYTNKPYVGFYSTKRVGSMLVDSEAIKALKFSAT